MDRHRDRKDRREENGEGQIERKTIGRTETDRKSEKKDTKRRMKGGSEKNKME